MFIKQAIPEVILVQPRRFSDERGYFQETYRQNEYEAAEISGPFVQDNHSLSKQAGIIRGLHFQAPPYPQAKLVRCTGGAIFDVAVDLRKGSPSYAQSVAVELTAENGFQLFIPAGFAHGFCTLTSDCEVQYKVSSYYDGASDKGIAWNDPDIAIDWPIGPQGPILSDKDAHQLSLRDLPDYFTYVPMVE